MMRRSLLPGLLLALVFCFRGVAAGATVAVFLSADVPYYEAIQEGFAEAMAGQSGVEIIVQRPAADMMAWKNTARKLVALDVDAIVAVGGNAAHIASEETQRIPIVYTAVYGAAEIGLTAPNVTGISGDISILNLMKVVRKTGRMKTLGVIYARKEVASVLQAKAIKALESSMGFDGKYYNLDDPEVIGKIEGIDALAVTASCSALLCADRVIGRARKLGVPTIAFVGGMEDRGAVFSYVPDAGEQGAKAAEMVKQILSGVSPSEIPPARPSRVNLVINLKEAEALGVKIPFDVLTSASRVIQAAPGR